MTLGTLTFDQLTEDLALLIQRGGYVMIPLLALSVISISLIAERFWFWGRIHGPSRPRKLTALTAALRSGDRPTAKALLTTDRSPYGRLVEHLMKYGPTDAVAVEAVEMERPRLQRFMVMLSTIITAAPLLGILGTVIGIIQSFRLLGQQSVLTDPRDVAGGIAAALLTTALGLIIAVITLFPYMSFKSQVDRALGRMEMLIAAASGIEKGRESTIDHPTTNRKSSNNDCSGSVEGESHGKLKSVDSKKETEPLARSAS